MKTSTTKFYNFFANKAGLKGGLNVSDDPLIVGPEEMTVARNVLIGQSLERKKRPGKEAYHLGNFEGTASYPTASGVPIRGIIQYHRYGSGTGIPYNDVFLHQDTKVWSIENRVTEAIDRTAALTLDPDSKPCYQVFEGILYFTDLTSTGYWKWNGLAEPAGNAENAVAPVDGPGKYLGIYNGRMIMAGNPDFPFRVYVSTALDAENWTGLDSTSFDLSYDGDPEGVTAIFPEKEGRLFVSTRRSLYEVTISDNTDIDTLSVRRVTRGIGCVGQGTVVATANDILFASDRGVHSLKRVIVSDQSEIQFLSREIQRLWTEILNQPRLNYCQAVWDEVNNLYVITCPSSGQQTNDIVLAYNLNFNYWTQWEGVNARSLGELLVNNKKFVLCGGESGRISFLNPNISTDFGEGFSFLMRTGKFFPDSMLTNQFRFVSVTALMSVRQPSNVSIGWTIDSADGSKNGSRIASLGQNSDTLGNDFVLGNSRLGIGSFSPFRFSIEDTGYNIQLEVRAVGNSDINFLGWLLEVEDADPVYT